MLEQALALVHVPTGLRIVPSESREDNTSAVPYVVYDPDPGRLIVYVALPVPSPLLSTLFTSFEYVGGETDMPSALLLTPRIKQPPPTPAARPDRCRETKKAVA